MLEHVPHWLGALLRNVRAGHAKLVIVQPDVAAGEPTIDLTSPAFSAGGRLPERFTADGAGVSPPLVWGRVPENTASLALIVEDPDAPASQPLVHAIVWDMPADRNGIAEGAISSGAGVEGEIGRNSFLSADWLPPDPPTGHGSHDYVFQLFALSSVPHIGDEPGRAAFVDAIRGKVVGAGLLVGTYSRGEEMPIAESDPALGQAR